MAEIDRSAQTKTTQTKQNVVQKSAPAPSAAPEVGSMQAAVDSPLDASPAAMLKLQRAYGNRAVAILVQRASAVGAEGGDLSGDVASQVQSARGGGQPLDKGVSASMGQSFGSDFSRVKVHTDSKADSLNRSLSAKAFTLGSDIFFAKGNYNPGTHSGKHLLAHELTHVVQQGGASTKGVQTKLVVGAAGDKYEQEADRIASHVMRTMSSGETVKPPQDEEQPIRRTLATPRITPLRIQAKSAASIQRVFSLNPKNWFKSKETVEKEKQEKEKKQKRQKDESDLALDEGRKYERNLGKYLFSHSKSTEAAHKMSQKMIAVLIPDFNKDDEDHQKQLSSAFGGAQKKYAGSVGTEFASVFGAINEGNLRERMTAMYNAMFGKFKSTMKEIIDNKNWKEAESRGLDVRKVKIRARQVGSIFKGGNVTAKDIYRDPGNPFDQTKSLSQEKGLLGSKTRTQNPDTITKRKVGELDEGPHKAGLGKYERKFMFPDKGEGEDVSGETLPWEEGGSKWTMRENSRWVNRLTNELKMPLTAGPSGTAMRFFQMWQWMNKPADAKDLRLALLGWMLTENDHSFHEIMSMGIPYKLPYEPGQKAYQKIDPLTTGELRSKVARDPKYPGLFPDEIAYHKKLDAGGFKLFAPYKSDMDERTQHAKMIKDQFGMTKGQYKQSGLQHLLKGTTAYTTIAYQVMNIVAGSNPIVAKVRISHMLKQNRKRTELLALLKKSDVDKVALTTEEQKKFTELWEPLSFGDKNILLILTLNPDTTAEELIKESKLHNEQTAAGMSLLPRFAGTVYRGETNLGMPYKKGKTFTLGKFMSTSRQTGYVTEYAKAKKFMTPVALVIETKSGRDVNAVTVNEDEGVRKGKEAASLDEVVLLPGTSLRVESDPEDDGRWPDIKAVKIKEVGEGNPNVSLESEITGPQSLIKDAPKVEAKKLQLFQYRSMKPPTDGGQLAKEVSEAEAKLLQLDGGAQEGWYSVSDRGDYFWAKVADYDAIVNPVVKASEQPKEEPPKPKLPDKPIMLYMNIAGDVGYMGFDEPDPKTIKSHAPDDSNPGWSKVMYEDGFPRYAKTDELLEFLGIGSGVVDVPKVEAPKDKADPKDYPAGRHNFKPDSDVTVTASMTDSGPLDQSVDVASETAKGSVSRFMLTDDWTRTYGRARFDFNGKTYWVEVSEVALLLGWKAAAKVGAPKVVEPPKIEPKPDENNVKDLDVDDESGEFDEDADLSEIFDVNQLSLLKASYDDIQYIVDMGSIDSSLLKGLSPTQVEALAKYCNEPLERIQKQIAELT